MSVTIRGLDEKPFEDFDVEVDLDVASILDLAKIIGLSVAVQFNGEGQITVLTETREDARALCKACFEEIEERSNLVNGFLTGF